MIISLKTKNLINSVIILVGNKTDLLKPSEDDTSRDSTSDSSDQRQTLEEVHAQEIADKLEVQLIKTSVFDGTNIEAVF